MQTNESPTPFLHLTRVISTWIGVGFALCYGIFALDVLVELVRGTVSGDPELVYQFLMVLLFTGLLCFCALVRLTIRKVF